MNRRLLDPFQTVELPEIIEEYLDQGVATAIAFNRRGTILAAGTAEGDIVAWDFDTKGVAKTYQGHNKPVTTVCWSRNGRFLASGSGDKHVILWDVLSGDQVHKVQLAGAVSHVSLSARPPHRAVVSFADGAQPVMVAFDDGCKVTPLLMVDGGGAGQPGALATFTKACDAILLGQARGSYLGLLDAESFRWLDVVQLPGGAKVNGLSLNRKGTLLLANCQDRVIRMFELLPRSTLPLDHAAGADAATLADALAGVSKGGKHAGGGSLLRGGDGPCLLQAARDFSNRVERVAWSSVCFSSDSEHVIGASGGAGGDAHHLYVWNRVYGNMECILEGPKEGAVAVAWHPMRSMLLSVSGMGRVFCWARIYAENWSAFAPDFLELDENVEYAEREDEFDWNTPGTGAAAPKPADAAGDADDDADVDVLSRDPADACLLSSDDEAELPQQLHHLPVVIEPDPEPDAEDHDEEDEDDGGGGGAAVKAEGEDSKGDKRGGEDGQTTRRVRSRAG